MKHAALASLLVVAGCFSKPSFSGRDGGAGSDTGGGEMGGGDDAMIDAMIDAPDGPPPVQLPFTTISAGGRHACAVGNDTRLWCWGDNEHGQVGGTGDLVTGNPTLATTNAALQSGWTDVAAGTDHTCGIRAGMVYCWGRNDARESKPTDTTGGDQTISQVVLTGLGTPMRVFAGNSISCVMMMGGTSYCWGALDLGAGATHSGVSQLTAGGNVTMWSAIALADDHGCAISTLGRLFCWGGDAHNGLGHDSALNSSRPYITPAETQQSATNSIRYRSVDVTLYTTCAVTTTNELHCWGSSGQGHLFNASDNQLDVTIDTSQTWADVSIDATFACARTTLGVIHCWGDDQDGAIGHGDYLANRNDLGTYVDVHGLMMGMTAITTGDGFACVLDPNANAWCWGGNRKGELGNREIATKDRPSRVRLPALGANDVIREIVAGFDFTCALVGPATGGAMPYCWGRNDDQQVTGNAMTAAEELPKPVTTTGTLVDIAAGQKHTCGRDATGANIWCWGDNSARQLGKAGGDGTGNHAMPGSAWTAVAAGSQASCAIADGRLWCWGAVPGSTAQNTPFDYGLTPSGWRWQALSMGSGFAVGIANPVGATLPHLVAFGTACPAGTGTSVDPVTPITAPMWMHKGTFQNGSTEYATLVIAASQHSGAHTCIHYTTDMDTTPRVTCWGDNSQKQVNQTETSCNGNAGDQTITNNWRTPVFGTQSIATANAHSCALGADNQLYCWGSNNAHELADRGPSTPGIPARINMGPWSGVTTGTQHTCVVDDPHKAVYCWGLNRHGQLGDGTRFRPAPVASGLVPP